MPADVPAWLKSLRLHKYAGLFSTMTYEEMLSLTEQQLEAQVSEVGLASVQAQVLNFKCTLGSIQVRGAVFISRFMKRQPNFKSKELY